MAERKVMECTRSDDDSGGSQKEGDVCFSNKHLVIKC